MEVGGQRLASSWPPVRCPYQQPCSKVFRISLAETVVVPGRHEMILPVKFKGAVCGVLFCACKIYILKQMKKPKPCITL